MKPVYAFCLLVSAVITLSVSAQQLVLPGDHPDPSVVKIGDSYWASATTSNWYPAFPLLESKDLVTWKTRGHVFNQLPPWADYYFWAPEITYENGKVYVYYAAHKKGGNLCIAVASADKPEGPYTDHGPLMCEEAGSIDAFPMRDENGKLYMIWKEDGNSVKKPTPIWAMQMNEERTALIGEKKELFRNKAPWEQNLVEGVSMIKHGGYYYAFYAAAGCCGAGCTYVSGVARSKSLLGPWEKDDRNPLITSNEKWICPGHGTPVEQNGRYYFLYHGYDKATNAFTGRQGLLNEFTFRPDGWIDFVQQAPTGDTTFNDVEDKFRGETLSANWQWSVFQNVTSTINGGELQLSALPSESGAFIGQKIMKGNYSAKTLVKLNQTTSSAGIAAIGDDKNIISLSYNDNKISVVQLKDGKETALYSQQLPESKKLYLRMDVANGKDITFFYSLQGKSYKKLNDKAIDGTYLPPWDRAVRVGLTAKGSADKKATFEKFELDYD